MTRARITRVFGMELEPNESRSFHHTVGKEGSQIVGLLHSNKASLSLSFQDAHNLEINNLENMQTDSLELPPIQRVISWEQDLPPCAMLRGNIQNLSKETRIVNLYVMMYA